MHPGSRGRNCAKGPATLNQVEDPERILYPLRRTGPRGGGQWERVTWDEVLDDIGARIRKALVEGRQKEVMYHLGRPGHELVYLQRVFHAWGIDGHNSHTNVCSASARAGYAFWHGIDRPSPDHANARFILLLSSHLETGHYFNPHAQRIIEAKMRGAKVCRHRLRGSATPPRWPTAGWRRGRAPRPRCCSPWPTCSSREHRYDREFVRRWVNWEEYLREERPDLPVTFDAFDQALDELYASYTPEFAAAGERRRPPRRIVKIARAIGDAGSALATHVWRNAAAGNLGGWQVARALELLVVLVGAVSTPGGTAPSAWNKAIPAPPMMPPPGKIWSELLMPQEYPLAFFEMSFLLPHFLREGRGKLAMYFTRVYNPVWTNPDGMSWIEMLTDEAKVERHACLTPVWSETAWFADYVLPMGHASERHDLMSPGDARRALDRLPPAGAARGAGAARPRPSISRGRRTRRPGWARSGRRTSSGSSCRGGSIPTARSASASTSSRRTGPARSCASRSCYRWIFENSVPGLPAAAAARGAHAARVHAHATARSSSRTTSTARTSRRSRPGTRKAPRSTPARARDEGRRRRSAWRSTGVPASASRRPRASSSSSRRR